jgi:hypothetical protein
MMEVDFRRSMVRADLEKQAREGARGLRILAAVMAPIVVYLVFGAVRLVMRGRREKAAK